MGKEVPQEVTLLQHRVDVAAMYTASVAAAASGVASVFELTNGDWDTFGKYAGFSAVAFLARQSVKHLMRNDPEFPPITPSLDEILAIPAVEKKVDQASEEPFRKGYHMWELRTKLTIEKDEVLGQIAALSEQPMTPNRWENFKQTSRQNREKRRLTRKAIRIDTVISHIDDGNSARVEEFLEERVNNLLESGQRARHNREGQPSPYEYFNKAGSELVLLGNISANPKRTNELWDKLLEARKSCN